MAIIYYNLIEYYIIKLKHNQNLALNNPISSLSLLECL